MVYLYWIPIKGIKLLALPGTSYFKLGLRQKNEVDMHFFMKMLAETIYILKNIFVNLISTS